MTLIKVKIEILCALGLMIPTQILFYKNAFNKDPSLLQERHLGKTALLLPMLRDFPRTTIAVLYYFDYKESFLPLIHVTCPTPNKYDITQISWYSYDVCE